MATWREIEIAGNESKHFQFTMAAYENALETVYNEKTMTKAEFGEVFLSSLGGLLAYSDDTEARDFFTALGVRF